MGDCTNQALIELLLDAYRPCANFGVCREAVWSPADGHIPRGFLGATGELSEVEVVMLFAEPGHAHVEECYDSKAEPIALLMAAMQHAHSCFSTGRDQFHQNGRWFMSQVYPGLSFDDQLQHVWMTEGRLCSITDEIGNTKDRTCAAHYLTRQIELLPNATVVAFGGKAQHYMKGMSARWLKAFALSPPGANQRKARPSWEAAIAEIKAHRAGARFNLDMCL